MDDAVIELIDFHANNVAVSMNMYLLSLKYWFIRIERIEGSTISSQ